MTELTQRKVGPSPASSPTHSSDGKDARAVRVTELDTRPVCANEAPRRYVQHGSSCCRPARGACRRPPAA